MEELPLMKQFFEEYKGYKLEDEDIAGHLEFSAFCAGFELSTEYVTKIDLPHLPKNN